MYISLDAETLDALHALAEQEHRRTRDQAVVILQGYFRAARVLDELARREAHPDADGAS